MKHLLIVAILATIVISWSYAKSDQKCYYWVDYNGIVPDEAMIGGQDVNGSTIYIGQVKIQNDYIPVPIYPQVPYVVATIPKSRSQPWTEGFRQVKVNSSIKILCTECAPYFVGAVTNGATLHVTLININPIIGGTLADEGTLHIGRVFYENEIKIGPIFSYDINLALLSFLHNSRTRTTSQYQVLGFTEF